MTRRSLLTTAAGAVVAGRIMPSPFGASAVAATPTEQAVAAIQTADPCSVYPSVPGINCEQFRLPDAGLSSASRLQALQQLHNYQANRQAKTLGFQANQDLSYQEDLKPFLDFHINNVGDPFQSGSFTMNSKWMEQAVLDYYAKLWNARLPHDPNDPESYWGYVLTMGSTEGNLYGLWNARDYLQGKCLLYEPEDVTEEPAGFANASSAGSGSAGSAPRVIYHQAIAPSESPNAYTPVAFYSEDTHYSVVKAMRLLEIHTFYEIGTNEYPGQCPITDDGRWPAEVPSEGGGGGPGSIDIQALVQLVDFFAARGYPIMVCFNYGTTFKGAYDDVEAAAQRLMPVLRKHGLWKRSIADRGGHEFERTGFWFHVDAALAGSYMPFVEMAHAENLIDQRGPNFDFRLPCVHSMTMSGHKWIGSPWPCGVYMSKTKYLLLPPSRPKYIGSRDSTLAGSRNGYSAMILWDYLAKHSYETQIQKALALEELTQYAHEQLLSLESSSRPLWVARTPLALTIRFRRPNARIVFKYSLANESLSVDGQRRDYSHIYVMSHVTTELIDELIDDLRRPDAFDTQTVQAADVGELKQYASTQFRPLLYVPEFGRGWR